MAKILSDKLQRKYHNFFIQKNEKMVDHSLESQRPGLSDRQINKQCLKKGSDAPPIPLKSISDTICHTFSATLSKSATKCGRFGRKWTKIQIYSVPM